MAKEEKEQETPKAGKPAKGAAPKGGAAKEKGSKGKAPKGEAPVKEPAPPPRLFELYKKEIIPTLMKRFGYTNVMRVPRLVKICVNMGVGQATQDAKLLDAAAVELTSITGQKAVITRARKSISNFKLREGMPIGTRVTLRRANMYEFLDRLISIAIPRVRDFRGVPDTSFDGRGNYTLGLKEQIMFPEIDVDKVARISGMNATFVTTARTDEEGYELLKSFGMPFVKRQEIAAETAGPPAGQNA
ncbi:MAG: 50S ribosomal protein L5 [Ignavibacteriales bacterium CG07_land_8_20_14_0_80_59_12]|nr:MAG: 50S ribosomal protein L5 [Ignavibacteriales bacterium CG07_land_8_20_14_0_80_59_12]